MARQTALPPRPPCQLYLITPPAIDDLEAFAGLLEQALSAGPVAALQIRLKDVDDSVIAAAVDVLLPIAQARGVAVTAGVTPAHFMLSDLALKDFRTFARLSPPLREQADRQGDAAHVNPASSPPPPSRAAAGGL